MKQFIFRIGPAACGCRVLRTLVITLLLASVVFSGAAQVVIKPGDKIIRYDWIKPSHDFYRNITTDPNGNITDEFMMEDVTTIDTIKKHIIFARSRQVPIGSFSTDTSVTNLVLKPLSMHEIHYQQRISFEMDFAENQVNVKAIKNGVHSVKSYLMENGYFEDNMTEYVLGYLELKKGVTYLLDNFNKDTPSPSDPYLIEYVFDDVWSLAAGHKLECDVFHFTHGNSTGYIWIDKSNHQMIKEEGNFKTGSYVITKM